jgi:hypothetical protein
LNERCFTKQPYSPAGVRMNHDFLLKNGLQLADIQVKDCRWTCSDNNHKKKNDVPNRIIIFKVER